MAFRVLVAALLVLAACTADDGGNGDVSARWVRARPSTTMWNVFPHGSQLTRARP